MRMVVGISVVLAFAAAALAQTAPVRPGEWETSVTISELRMPGASGGALARARGTTTDRSCVTAEQTAHGFRDMLSRNGSCQVAHFSQAGGRLDADMTCSGMHMVIHGTYSPTTMTVTSHAEKPGGISMTSTVTGRYLGPCE